MKVSYISRAAVAAIAVGFLAAGSASAQKAEYIRLGESDRFKVYSVSATDNASDYVENNKTFLLDSHTGEVYVRIGSAEAWTSFVEPHDVQSFPRGGQWAPPRFGLSVARTADGEARLLLTNLASGAHYTRTKSGRWTPFRHPVRL